MSCSNDSVPYITQLQAWIWETGVKFGFKDVTYRVEKELKNPDVLKNYFKEGRQTWLLFNIRTLQKISQEIQLKGQICSASLKRLGTVTVDLLSDPDFYSETTFIKSLLCFYYSALILVFRQTEKSGKDSSAFPVPVNPLDWKSTKKFFGFKDDYYKTYFTDVRDVYRECRQLLLTQDVNDKEVSATLKTLRNQLEKLCAEVVKYLIPAALLNVWNDRTRDELRRLRNPVFDILLSSIEGRTITAKCLHAILNNLAQFTDKNSQDLLASANMKRKCAKALPKTAFPKEIGSPLSKHLLKNDLCSTKCRNNKSLKQLDVIVLNDVYWEIEHANAVGEKERVVRREDVVSFKRASLTKRTCETTFLVKTRAEKTTAGKALPNGVETTFDKDIASLLKLTEDVRKILGELELKTLHLMAKRDLALKLEKENAVSVSVMTSTPAKNGETRPLNLNNNEESDSESRRTLNRRIASPPVEESSSITKANSKSRTLNVSCSSASLPDLNDLSMPNLSNQLGEESADIDMPMLSPQKNNLNVTNQPILQLTPLSKSIINKYYSETSNTEASDFETNAKSQKRRKKITNKSFKKRRKKCPSESENWLEEKENNNSLRTINLVVTEAHSSFEHNAIILEASDKSLSPSLLDVVQERGGKECTPDNTSGNKERNKGTPKKASGTPKKGCGSLKDTISSPKKTTVLKKGEKGQSTETPNPENEQTQSLHLTAASKDSLDDFCVDPKSKTKPPKPLPPKDKKRIRAKPKPKKLGESFWKKRIFSSGSGSSSDDRTATSSLSSVDQSEGDDSFQSCARVEGSPGDKGAATKTTTKTITTALDTSLPTSEFFTPDSSPVASNTSALLEPLHSSSSSNSSDVTVMFDSTVREVGQADQKEAENATEEEVQTTPCMISLTLNKVVGAEAGNKIYS